MRRKIWGGFLLAVMAAIMAPALANAQTIETHSTRLVDNPNYAGLSAIIQREITGVKNEVNVNFTYELVEDESNPAPIGNMPTSAKRVQFHKKMPNDGGIASSSASIDLRNLEFDTLGDYKLILREISSTDPENYPVDEEHVYYYYISVRNELENGVPTGNLIATMLNQVRDHDTGDKTNAFFTSAAVRTYIELSKNVTGNLADTSEYFKFLVRINGGTGDNYTISGQDASVSYNGETIMTTSNFVVGEDGVEVYLKHGQTIRIGQDSSGMLEVPISASYTIQEMNAEDYTTTVDGASGKLTGTKTTAVLLDGDVLPEANQTEFVNNKNSAVLTGVTLAMIPAAVVIVSLFVGAVVVRKIKKSSDKR